MVYTSIVFVIALLYCHKVNSITLENRIKGPTARIVQDGSQKHLVPLKIGDDTLCSGSIIAPYWVLTAAHCFNNAQSDDNVSVFHPSHHYGKIGTAKVRDVQKHPWFDVFNPVSAFDLTLIRTQDEMQFNEMIRPIKLGNQGKIEPRLGDRVVTAGFGDNDLEYRGATKGIVEISECTEVPDIKYNAICSYDSVAIGHGDSGGSLVLNGVLVGVNSAGYKEDDKMSVYVNVPDNLKWILNTILLETFSDVYME